MQYDQTIITPKGLAVHIRNGVASDGSAVLENFNLTHAETDYLLSYPDENHFDAEQESRYLEKKETSPNEIELIAFVDGKVAGTAGIDAIGTQLSPSRKNGQEKCEKSRMKQTGANESKVKRQKLHTAAFQNRRAISIQSKSEDELCCRKLQYKQRYRSVPPAWSSSGADEPAHISDS